MTLQDYRCIWWSVLNKDCHNLLYVDGCKWKKIVNNLKHKRYTCWCKQWNTNRNKIAIWLWPDIVVLLWKFVLDVLSRYVPHPEDVILGPCDEQLHVTRPYIYQRDWVREMGRNLAARFVWYTYNFIVTEYHWSVVGVHLVDTLQMF